ncbi:MAG: hypothetical protein AABW68_00420 [archaeon]
MKAISNSHSYAEWVRSHGFLLAGVIAFLFFFFSFYPPFFVAIDEHEYLKNAFLLREGSLIAPDHSLYCGGNILSENRSISSYPIGKSISLIPFTFLPFSWVFLSGLLLHLFNFLLIYIILRRDTLPGEYSLLYLFLPLAAWESRTLFPELGVLTLFLSGYWLWKKDRFHSTFGAGLLLGLSVFFRVDAVIGPLAFLVQAVVKERSKVIPFIAGGLIPALLFFGFNAAYYGGFLSTGYGSTIEQVGSAINPAFLKNVVTYMALLFVALPFSLWAIFRSKKEWPLFAVLSGGTILLFSHFTNFWDFSFSLPLTFTARLRYFLPLLGLLLIPTMTFYHLFFMRPTVRKFTERVSPAVIGGVFLLLAAGGLWALNSSHYQLAAPRGEISAILPSFIPESSIVIGSADDCIYFLDPLFGERHYYPISNYSNQEVPAGAYLLDIGYTSQQGKGGPRSELVDAERELIRKYFRDHSDSLTQVFEGENGFHLIISTKD